PPETARQVLGAALFGANKRSIISRKARLTYGTAVMSAYDPADPEHRQRKSQISFTGGKLYLKTFKKYVERSQDLPVGTDKEHAFSPLTDAQENVTFDILVTKQCAADVQYVKDGSASTTLNTLVTVDVPVDMTSPFARRGMSMRLSFGGTELGITCKRDSDGKEVK
ncbi:unnamed protein product, partial [Sphacelaria rigidula]